MEKVDKATNNMFFPMKSYYLDWHLKYDLKGAYKLHSIRSSFLVKHATWAIYLLKWYNWESTEKILCVEFQTPPMTTHLALFPGPR